MFTPSNAVQRLVQYSGRPAVRVESNVISLASGDPDFETPSHIVHALIEALNSGYTHYGHYQGDAELRSALAAKASEISGSTYSANHVLITHGASGALASAIHSIIDPGDRVLLPEPTYSLYADLVRLAGAEPVFVPSQDDFHLDLGALSLEAKQAKLLILCHPCNPTGVVYRRDELQAVAELADYYDLWILADEAYDHIIFNGVEFVSTLGISELRERLIYCQTFSKTYAMTGWRVGYIVAPTEAVSAMTALHRTFNGALNTAVQRAALAAVTMQTDWPNRMLEEYHARRELTLELLAGIPGIEVKQPEGTFYAFVHFGSAMSSSEVASKAIEHGVAVRAGSEFGPSGEGYIRLAFATDREKIRAGISRLRPLLTAQL